MMIPANGTKLPPIMGVNHEGEHGDLVASVHGHWAAILLYRGDW